MNAAVSERNRLALLGCLATVAMSLSFITAVEEKGYVLLGGVTSLVLVVAGIALRALRVPNLVVLPLQLVLLGELLLWGFGDYMKWGLFPTGRTWSHLDGVISGGVSTAQDYAAPAPPHPGLLLMLVFFVAIIALLVDLTIAVNRVPLAGLPLLALYTVPVAALPDGVPFLSFLAGAAAYVGLLTAAERDRLAHWGRLIAHGSVAHADDTMDTSALRSTGQRIAALSLATAVVVPVVIPTLSSSLLDGGNGLGTGDGTGTSIRFNDPMVSLASALRRDEEVDLIEVSSDVTPSYLRMTVLDEPGATTWSTGTFDLGDTISVGTVLPAPTGLTIDVERTPHAMTINPTDEFPSNSTWFPVPFNIGTLDASDDDWAYFQADQTVVARNGTAVTRVDEITVSYASLNPTPEELSTLVGAGSEIHELYGTVPGDIPASVINEARQVTAGADTDYERAALLQSYFRDIDRFTYDVEAGYGYGYEAMAEFLEEGRGFCQHFSATMAMMARAVGIPSRVVVGLLNPTKASGDDYVFTSHDLHAWPELYFEGIGWVRFEPTPGVGAPLPRWAPDATPTLGPSQSTTLPTAPSDDLTARPSGSDSSSTLVGDEGQAGGGSDASAPSPWWLLPPGLLLLALAPAMLRRGIRRHRLTRPIDEASAAEAAWLELKDHMRDLRMPWTGSMTPRAREQAIAPLLREDATARAALGRLMMSVERARYAVKPLADASPATDAVMVMDELAAGVGRRHRLRALLWPSSLMPDLARGWTQLKARVRRQPSPTA